MRLLPWSLAEILVLGLAVFGCGGGDSSTLGLDRSKYLDELSMDEIRQFCAWKAGLAEPGQYQCSNGTTMTIQTANECLEDAQQGSPVPHCLVSLAEDCFGSAAGDPCQVRLTDPCKSYAACINSQR